MTEILELVDMKYLDQRFNVSSLINIAGHSYSVLYEKFMFSLDISPQKYIENKRMETALKLMMEDTNKITSICKAVGYSNCKTFRGVFKRGLREPRQR